MEAERMAKRGRSVVLSRRDLLRDSERQGTSMSLPLAIYHRLDLLTEAAAASAAHRAELIGMLIANAPLDPEWLEQRLLEYRKATVGDVIPDEGASTRPAAPDDGPDNVVAIEPRSPGRPARRQSS
jgi:hypothetical protein